MQPGLPSTIMGTSLARILRDEVKKHIATFREIFGHNKRYIAVTEYVFGRNYNRLGSLDIKRLKALLNNIAYKVFAYMGLEPAIPEYAAHAACIQTAKDCYALHVVSMQGKKEKRKAKATRHACDGDDAETAQ